MDAMKCGCLAFLVALGSLTMHASPAAAQQEADIALQEIVVIGTRRSGRTVIDSPVPIDLIEGTELVRMGTGDMDDILRTLIPSYSVLRFPLDDEASIVRPATLRALPPDHTLVLINGKRRHRTSVIASRVGTQGPDLATIPSIAVERLEVLRDGAAAQYGSDATAGVLNFVLRGNRSGIVAGIEAGQFYKGDGQARKFAGNAGFALADEGFLNLSLEYGKSDPTSRAIQRPDAAALDELGASGIPDPAQNWGQPTIEGDLKVFLNAAMQIGDLGELYGFGGLSDRSVELEFFWRNPNFQDGIYTLGGYGEAQRLVFDLTGDGSGNCAAAGTANAIPAPHPDFPTQADYDADQAVLADLAADPDCWVVNELYPGGYKPLYGADISDRTAVVGYRGEVANGLTYDVSGAFGTNRSKFKIADTINASLGPSSPTSFTPGTAIQREINFNADVAFPVEAGLYSPLHIAAGFEWREETFEIRAGDQASWEDGRLHPQGASIGSHGYAGYSPDQAGKWQRSNFAVYLDFEADATERLLLALAGRYEEFEDFGSTSNYKVAARYRFNDLFALRASANTGFRAPTPGQSNQTRVNTSFDRETNQLQQGGLIPPTNPVAMFYGGKALEPEETENVSFGFTLEPRENLTISLDFFRIDLENGMSISNQIFPTPEEIAQLVAAGVPNASDFAFIQYRGNEVEARIEGYDLVATYGIDWDAAGRTELSAAWSDNQSEFRFLPEEPNRNDIVTEENKMRYRGIFTVNHNWNDLRLLVRVSYYDGWVWADFRDGPLHPVCSDERPVPLGHDGCYGDKWIVDIEAAYTLADRYTVTLGADNLFDEYPDTDYLYPDFSFGGIYPTDSPYGYNGGFWYLRLTASF